MHRTDTAAERTAFSPDEIATRNGLGRATIWREIAAGKLIAKMIGRRRIITAEAEKAWQDAMPAVKPKVAA